MSKNTGAKRPREVPENSSNSSELAKKRKSNEEAPGVLESVYIFH